MIKNANGESSCAGLRLGHVFTQLPTEAFCLKLNRQTLQIESDQISN